MLCYWGSQVREGLGLLQPDRVKHGSCGVRSVCPKSAVQDMSAGRSFVGFIRDGKVSVLRLQSGDNKQDGKIKPVELKNDKIRSIVCGGDAAVLLAYGGKVLIMDKSTVCRPLEFLKNRQVIQIACGDQHSMALTNDGQVFVWGQNSHGQLGLGRVGAGSVSAQHLQSLCGIPVAQISAGGKHSFVLSLSGVVFGWGNNSAGQLGLGDTTDRHVPTILKCLNGKKIVSISCGGEHTAALSKGGTVFTFGSGGFGQLGHNSFKDEHHPRVVGELWGSEVSQVTCGRNHTLVSVTSSNQIYSFGCGKQGQLGNGKMINQSVPLLVILPNACNHEYVIDKLIAGENHSFALFSKKPGNESAKPKPKPGILTLNDRMIERWVSERDSWATVKKEIKKVFSSPACLNASFLKTSLDEQDFDLVEKSFSKLLGNEKVISKVVQVVQQTLLPSLNTNPASEESLRVYLILPQLIKCLQKRQRTELTAALASNILVLYPAACRMLEMYWTILPHDWYKCFLKLFHNESAELIGQISRGEIDQDLKHLQIFLQILQMAYKVSQSTENDITNRNFIIHEINDLLDTVEATTGNLFDWLDYNYDLLSLMNYYTRTIKILSRFPFVAETVSKQRMFRHLQQKYMHSVCNKLHINRESVLTDTLEHLRQNSYSFFPQLKVTFIGENGIDERGLSAEFFSLLSKSLLNWEKKVLEVNGNSLVWFNLDQTQDNSDFYYLGVICGMALYNRHYINIKFSLALFKKLLNLSPTLKDLEELSPVEARGLKNLLDADEDVVDLLFLDFTVKGQELIPNGDQILVTKVNRQKYVDLYINFVFNESVKNQFEHFSRGFSKGCPLDAWTMFHPEELQELLHGCPTYDWQELPQAASYEGCSASDQLIINFWTVFFEFSEENKTKFLVFLYGTESVPVGGLSKRPLKISQSNCPDPDDHLPEAQTCFGRLILPKYSDINTLRIKLTHAISFCRTFGRG